MITVTLADDEIAKFVNRLTKLSNKYAGCQSIRDVISNEVNSTLRNKKGKTNVPTPK